MQARPAVAVAPRPWSHARAVKERSICQCVLNAVRVHARGDVEGARAQRFNNGRIFLAKLRDQMVDDVERRHAARDLDSVNVGVDPVRGFGVVLARAPVGDGGNEQLTTHVRLAVTLDREQVRVLSSERVQPLRHLVVSQETVKVVGHVPRLDRAATFVLRRRV